MALIDNLVSYWKLDGNSNDSVSANNGTDTSMTYALADGKINQGGHFSGSGYISMSDAAFPSGTAARTINIWFKTSTSLALNNYMDLFEYATRGVSGENVILYQMNITGHNNQIAIGTYANDVYSTSTYNDGNWHMMTVTYDGTTWTLYVDGSSVNSGVLTTNTVLNTARIGAQVDNGNPYQGSLDEVGIWSRSLSSTEVSQLYNSGAGLAYPFSTVIPGGTLSLMGVG